jgi:LmbE family N-acetylglucosaminyl deacetylase
LRRAFRRSFLPLLLCAGFGVPSVAAQLEPPSTGGIVALDHELRMLGHYRRVLVIGAHPDDEDTELLTVLVRGMGAEAAYLSLNRGEGGQNLIGPELGDALGLIRTEELLAARRLDGARQYFTRAYDFGYSKTLEETWAQWPRDTILKDVVRVVRRFRPQVVVSIFRGNPRDGHGQHQAAGWVAREAFTVAGDSTRFPELLREEGLQPWAPLKLYRSARFDTVATTLMLDGGSLDPVVGKSYHQIAMAGRSLHRSQDMGQLQTIGPSPVRLALLENRATADTAGGDQGLFAGIDTTLDAMPRREVGRNTNGHDARRRFDARVDSARALLHPGGLHAVSAMLRRAERDLYPDAADGRAHMLFSTIEQSDQRRHLERALALSAGLVLDAVADDDRVLPGQPVPVEVSLWNTGGDTVRVDGGVVPSALWHVQGEAPTETTLLPGEIRRTTVTVMPDSAAPYSTPYFLRRPRQGSMYDWSVTTAVERGEPFAAPEPMARAVRLDAGGDLSREVSFRIDDQARGEVRRPLTVVPRVDVKLDPGTDLWSLLVPGSHRFTVTLTHGARDTTSGRVRLQLPSGWPAVPSKPFRLTAEDERESFVFDVRLPKGATAGTFTVGAEARDSVGDAWSTGLYTVDYPHIRPRSYAREALAEVHLADLALPRLTAVGYIRGASDRVPEALQRVGLPVTLLDHRTLEGGDLGRFDVIVVGPRAYETDSTLVENNSRLLDYVRAGGVVVVQYQQQVYFEHGYAPMPMTVGGPRLPTEADSTPAPGGSSSGAQPAPTVGHDRVTDETAPVTLLTPDDPVFTRPNRITDADWEGWVQERGLYFARSWDPGYRPLLEMHDPGDAPLEGGLLMAKLGKGTYVYTGLSFFRQLPAGVPGAFRLFANLLALAAPAPLRSR